MPDMLMPQRPQVMVFKWAYAAEWCLDSVVQVLLRLWVQALAT